MFMFILLIRKIYKDFKTFHFEQAVAFKRHLAEQKGQQSGKKLSKATLHVTLTHKKGVTSILFVRPSQVAVDSPAKKVVTELELDVIRAIEQGFIP